MAAARAALSALRRRRPLPLATHAAARCLSTSSTPHVGSDVAATPPLLADAAAPVSATAALVDGLHAATGLPWWAAIPATAFGVRLALTPLSLLQARAAASLGPLLAQARAEAAAEQKDGQTPPFSAVAARASALAQKQKGRGPHPAWIVAAPLAQIPVFATCVLTIRAMALADWPGFAAGGPPWATDLTARAVDVATATAPLGLAGGVLPAAIAALTLASAAAGPGRAAAAAAGTRAARTAASVRLLIEWCAVPAACGALLLPQGAALYWASSSAAALAVGAIVRRTVGRRRQGTAPTDAPPAAAALVRAAHLRAAGDITGAVAAAEAAVTATPADPRAWFALAQLRAGGRDWGGAEDAYGRSVAVEADAGQRARARFGLGVAQHVQGDLEAAVDAFAAAIVDAEAASGGFEAAVAAAERARSSSQPPPPRSSFVTLGRALLARAAALADVGRVDDALVDARKAARLEPEAERMVEEIKAKKRQTVEL